MAWSRILALLTCLAAMAAAFAMYRRAVATGRQMARDALVEGALVASAAMVVTLSPRPNIPTVAQVSDACAHIGASCDPRFAPKPGGLTPPPRALAAVVVHPAPVNGVLVGFYPTSAVKSCEVTDQRVVRISGSRHLAPADVKAGDQVLWLVPVL
jgi:hypothetical protein